MLLLQNSPQFVLAFLGASYIGAVATMANPFFTPPEIAKHVASSGAKLIITQAVFAEKVKSLVDKNGVSIKLIFIDPPPDGEVHFSVLTDDVKEEDMPDVKISPNDVVALPYSSGTTGLPKGVMLTHRGLVTSVAQQVDGENPHLYIRSDDVVLCVLPLFHIYSLNSIMMCSLRVGAAILIVQKFDINYVVELVGKYKVTIAPLVPPIVLAIAKSPAVGGTEMSSIRMVLSGAAPLGKELEDAFRAKLPDAILGQVRSLFKIDNDDEIDKEVCGYIGIWHDGGGVGADVVAGVCKGEVPDKIRSLWDVDEKFRYENCKPSNWSFSS